MKSSTEKHSWLKNIQKSYPYLEAGEGIWCDSLNRLYTIDNEYEYSDEHLIRSYCMIWKESKKYKNNEPLRFLYDLFKKKESELWMEIERRNLEHRVK